VITQLLLLGTPGYVVVADTWAIAAEAVFFATAIRGLSARRAIGAAVAANAMSFLAGRVIGYRPPIRSSVRLLGEHRVDAFTTPVVADIQQHERTARGVESDDGQV